VPQSDKLLAWIEPREGEEFMAAFVGSGASTRLPAIRRCSSPDEGQQWVEREATILGVPVQWVEPRWRGCPA
jgi:hypothetical protein